MWATLITCSILIAIDLYAVQAVRTVLRRRGAMVRGLFQGIYWFVVVVSLLIVWTFYWVGWENITPTLRGYMLSWLTVTYVSKVFVMLPLFLEDLWRMIHWIAHRLRKKPEKQSKLIGRRLFISQAGVLLGGFLLGQFLYGMARTVYQFRIVRVPLRLPGLPDEFHGWKIVQISDLHLGSFPSTQPIRQVVDMINQEHPHCVFFTGDLINNLSREADPFICLLQEIRAPHGVFSVRGNHDFADYFNWSSEEEKLRDRARIEELHEQLGWRLLRNEHVLLGSSNQKLAIAGVDNWSMYARFRRYGDLDRALRGTELASIRLLLAHDPSLWIGQVQQYPLTVHAMFSGHTHGAQFGVEWTGLHWSPAQWWYPHWAGLYRLRDRLLYVNRGIGFVGYNGRVGIRPEITVFELVS